MKRLALVALLALGLFAGPSTILAQEETPVILEVVLALDPTLEEIDTDLIRDLPPSLEQKLDGEGIRALAVEWTDDNRLRVEIDMGTVKNPFGLLRLLEGPLDVYSAADESELPLLEFVDFSAITFGQIPEGARIVTTEQVARVEAALDAGEIPPFEDAACPTATDELTEPPVYCRADGTPFITLMTGAGLADAAAVTAGQIGAQWMVRFTLAEDGEGVDAFLDYVANNPNRTMAIVLDGWLLSYPTIQPDLSASARAGTIDGGVITGGFTRDEAKLLAAQLNGKTFHEVSLRVEDFRYLLPGE